MTTNKGGRPSTVGRKTSVGLRRGIEGWIEFRAMEHGGIAGYFNDMAEDDRDKALGNSEIVERYRAYLVATGRTDELAALGTLLDVLDELEAERTREGTPIVTEVRTPDGGVGICLEGGDLWMGYDRADVARAFSALVGEE